MGSQGTICGGGRYDYLIEQIGGKAAPAVGWALGVERVLEFLKEQGSVIPLVTPDVYAVIPDVSALPVAIATLEGLRAWRQRSDAWCSCSGGGHGQHEIAVQEGGRQWCPACAGVWIRRVGSWHGLVQVLARWQRFADRAPP